MSAPFLDGLWHGAPIGLLAVIHTGARMRIAKPADLGHGDGWLVWMPRAHRWSEVQVFANALRPVTTMDLEWGEFA